ncbi:MAG: GTPase/DUF3482 domain-containing protein [Pseudomonadota bacterium]
MTPRFAVVGHPNKGKSSIVSTLVEMSEIPISNTPGSTYKSQSYAMRIQNQTLYNLIDTPGFQRPHIVLSWLQSHCQTADARPRAISKFLSEHRDHPDYVNECELLKPLVDGAGILYVVDGSKPYGSEYEAEMEILRWTGRPRMALINLIGKDSYIEEWQAALDQYFGLVRIFDAFHADLNKRIALLISFGELNQEWQPELQKAIQIIDQDWSQRKSKSAAVIAKLLFETLTFKLNQKIDNDSQAATITENLNHHLKDRIRNAEHQARKAVEYIYRYQHIDRKEPGIDLINLDLFSSESMQLFGLSRKKLIATGAASGATAGLGVDVLLGGTSLLLGSSIGAVVGGVSAAIGSSHIGKLKKYGMTLAKRSINVGPIKDPNLPWALLSRALLHHKLISERNHALRNSLSLEAKDSQNIADSISEDFRSDLNEQFNSIRRKFNNYKLDKLKELIESNL